MKDADLADDSWHSIEQDIAAGDHPSREDIASALRRGEPVPTRCQTYLADLLSGALDRRGRPRKAAGHGGFSSCSKYFVEHMAESNGLSVERTLEILHSKEGRDIELETWKKNYYASSSEKIGSDNRIFETIGTLSLSWDMSGSAEPTIAAIEELHEKLGMNTDEVQRAYVRSG